MLWIEKLDGEPRKLPKKLFVRNGWESRQAVQIILPTWFPQRAFLVLHEHADTGKQTLEIVGMEEEDGA